MRERGSVSDQPEWVGKGTVIGNCGEEMGGRLE